MGEEVEGSGGARRTVDKKVEGNERARKGVINDVE